MSVTITDLFCGAGGSSLGAELAGARLQLGLNHWDRAVETHAANFEHAEHDCEDVASLTTSRIRAYPDPDILLASPECTCHSLAKGARRRRRRAASLWEDGPAGDAEQERSRATMWDVVRFCEQKLLKGRPYQAVIVENVVDVFRWGADDDGGLFSAWLNALAALGYQHEIVWLNSMFCPPAPLPVPQSRDRMYVVLWRRGLRRPNLRVEPPAWCRGCERVVAGRQTWKNPGSRVWGRYAAQYFYSWPDCHQPVLPGASPAATSVDRTLPAPRIGERQRRERIGRGLERLEREPFAIRLTHGGVPRPLTLPLVTLTARHDAAMVLPVAANTFERTAGNRARAAQLVPLDTVHATLDRALVVPAMGEGRARDADQAAAPTQTTTTRAALVMANTEHGVARPADRESAQTLRTQGGLALITRTGHKGANGHLAADPELGPAKTQTTAGDQALVLANRAHNTPRPASEHPAQAVCTGGHLGIVISHFSGRGSHAGGIARHTGRAPIGSLSPDATTTRSSSRTTAPGRRPPPRRRRRGPSPPTTGSRSSSPRAGSRRTNTRASASAQRPGRSSTAAAGATRTLTPAASGCSRLRRSPARWR